jgi:hypothetical protein
LVASSKTKSWRRRKFRFLTISSPCNDGTKFWLRHCEGGGYPAPAAGAYFSEPKNVNIETPDLSQPGMAERAIDTATDVSRTITEVSEALRVAVDRLSGAIAAARQPGMPLSTVSAITREAPLASLFFAFLFGVAVARRR